VNRKEFLDLVGRGALFAATAPVFRAVAAEAAAASTRPALTSRQRGALSALADEIVPAGDDMPAATAVGAVQYLDALVRREPEVALVLRGALAVIEKTARTRHRRRFDRLAPRQRVAVLEAMERDDPEPFRALRDLVYEAYYTQPAVWRRLGYDFIGPERSGPPLEPFEEALLDRVRAMPRLFRQVP